MAVNFIVTGDLHWRVQNPRSRKDNYMDALKTKLQEVFQMAEHHDASGIIIPGDIFDSPNASLPGIYSLIQTLYGSPCKIVTVPGNHDEFGANIQSIYRAPYGFLRELEFIHCVNHKPISDAGTGVDDEFFVDISGHGYDTDTDADMMQYGLPFNIYEDETVKIHITHGMLLDRPMMDGVRHTLIGDLERIPAERRPNILINGHYHTGLPLTWIGKTLVINPGALGRLSASKEEMTRPIQVALLKINGPNDYNAEFIPLKSARPGHEVLTREHIEEEQARDERLDAFLRLLNSEGEQKYLEVQEIIEGIAKSDNLPKVVVEEALKRIGEAREAMGRRDGA